jgi:hypothetical protein
VRGIGLRPHHSKLLVSFCGSAGQGVGAGVGKYVRGDNVRGELSLCEVEDSCMVFGR